MKKLFQNIYKDPKTTFLGFILIIAAIALFTQQLDGAAFVTLAVGLASLFANSNPPSSPNA